MAIDCYEAVSCPVAGQTKYVWVENWPSQYHGKIAIEVDGVPEIYVDALAIDTSTVHNHSGPVVQVVSSGETNCAKARKKYGL